METEGRAPRECLVMAKPGGPRCNLACDYCYYLDREGACPSDPWPMSEELLESYISQRIAASSAQAVHFEWHGGEPGLLGLDYFRLIVRLQHAHLPPGRRVTNGIQTNGLLIDGPFADFLAAEGFSVGLSLDGPADLHDRHRRGPDGSPTQSRVMAALGLLKQRGVFCNLLCVLHEGNAAEPDRVYAFFKEAGAKYLQFLPLVPRLGQAAGAQPGAAAAATASAIGGFLCRVFDLWIREDVGRLVVQSFDEALRPIYGAPHALCVHRETCGDVAVLERGGNFYACDHYVDEWHLIGNLRERSLAELVADPRLLAFGEAKRSALPQACLDCSVLPSCNGGCPKDRDSDGLNRLCAAYKSFFTHSKPELTRLAAHMRAGRSLRSFRALPADSRRVQ
jgi:uncharacterized protein